MLDIPNVEIGRAVVPVSGVPSTLSGPPPKIQLFGKGQRKIEHRDRVHLFGHGTAAVVWHARCESTPVEGMIIDVEMAMGSTN